MAHGLLALAPLRILLHGRVMCNGGGDLSWLPGFFIQEDPILLTPRPEIGNSHGFQ